MKELKSLTVLLFLLFLCNHECLGSYEEFPCKCQGPSIPPPDNVNKLRLEDIEMVAAIGDSDTAAFAANSGGPFTYFTEYWGASFSTGTDGSWRSHPTLANLLLACNKLLIGGSSGSDSVLFPDMEGRGLNVAVSGDWAGGAPAQARELVTRIR